MLAQMFFTIYFLYNIANIPIRFEIFHSKQQILTNVFDIIID